MPIWLRKYTFNKIKDFYEKPKKEAEKQQMEKMKSASKKIPINPNVYNVKAPKK